MGKRNKGHNAQKTPSKADTASGSSNQPAAAGSVQSQQMAPNNCYPLNKLCRLCLLSNATMEPIFAYPGDITLSQKIFQCTNLEIHENEDDGIPSSICSQCKRQLDQCYEFRLLCWKNNEVLQNLHTLLNSGSSRLPPVRKECATPLPFVQVEKLDISASMLPQNASSPERTNTPKEFDTIALDRLYKPRSRGRKSGQLDKSSGFTRELVIRLVPISPSLIKKYKKAVASPATKHVTQTKAAVKSYAQPAVKKGRKPLPTLKVIFKPSKQKSPTVSKSKTKRADKTKRPEKAKQTEIAVPPKKRKQNFEESTVAAAIVACTLCTQTFSNQKNLSRHMATHENNRKQSRVFNCDVCKKEYLKASQLTDHLRSAEHIRNAVSDEPDDDVVESILPDESEATTTAPAEVPPAAGRESAKPSQDLDHSGETAQSPLPETDDLYEQIESLNDHFAQDDSASSQIVIPIDDSDSSSLGHGVQYSEVCSTNDSEALFNSLKDNSHHRGEKRRVSFANVTEIVE